MNELLNHSLVQKAINDYELPLSYVFTINELMNINEKNDDNLLTILISMFIYLYNGSICIKKNKNLKNLLSNLDVENPEKFMDDFFSNIENYSKIIGKPDEYKPLIYIKEKESLYFEKYYTNEKKVNEILKARREYKENNKDIEKIKSYVSSKTNLHEFQKAAVFLSLIKPFLIISGGPGTGKTTIIKYTIDYLIENNIFKENEIAITTPTGKASQRIKELLSNYNIETSTIHRLLRYNYIIDSFYYNSENKLPYKMIILDEVSMVDIVLLRNFLEAIPDDCQLIMIGDKDQLPSVEAGTFIAKIIPENYKNVFSSLLKKIVDEQYINDEKSNDSIVLLTKSFRSEKNILEFANKVNEGKTDLTIDKIDISDINEFMTFNDFIAYYDYINPLNFKKLYLSLLLKQFNEHYFEIIEELKSIESTKAIDKIELLKEILKIIESFKILTITNIGFYGCDRINDEFIDYLKKKLNKKSRFFSGIPVIINKNDYNINVFNGNIGVLIEFSDGFKGVFLSSDVKIIPVDLLPNFNPAFAITVHKSQGSEYERILLVIPEETRLSILTRQILYTGITRAKKAVLIAGKKENILNAINNSIERESNIE